MHHTTNHAGTRVCVRCGHQKPVADFRLSRTGRRLSPKCWLCRYLAARTPRGRISALPPSPFDAPRRPAVAEPPLTRVCRKCGIEKPLGEFRLRYSTGRRYCACRACHRAAIREWYANNREKHRAITARSRARENPEQRRARERRCRKRHPKEHAVRQRTGRLRVLGVLALDPECADCGGPAADLHHEVYGDVCSLVSLCRRCHMARHFREWRKHGGGPVKYPWEHEEQ